MKTVDRRGGGGESAKWLKVTMEKDIRAERSSQQGTSE